MAGERAPLTPLQRRAAPPPVGAMIRVRATRYDAPGAIGTLRNASKLWSDVVDAESSGKPHSLLFTFTCRGEARAKRVVAALRRRVACASALVVPSGRIGSALWHVQGRTHPLPQSLANLEELSNWLRELAGSHQVRLVRFNLA